jgi:large subunit ribosomal protein L10
MALTRKEKVKLFKEYDNLVENNRTMIVVSYNAIPVNTIVKMRKEFKEKVVVYKVVKKRVFVKVLEERGYDVDLGNLEGSVAILFSNDEGINGLKIIEKYKKEWKKNKLKSSVEYLGGWFDKEWRGADYVKVLSQIPSKEELV